MNPLPEPSAPTAKILGLSAYYHDSAAALVVDGQIVAAAQEERFTRKKHDDRFPSRAVEYCLREGGLAADDLDYVVFYDKPLLKFERLLETYLAFAPAGLRSFLMAMPLWLKTKLHLPREIRRNIGGAGRWKLVFTGHHESHAASAFFPSPFAEAAILTMDGVGEWETASIGAGRGNRIEMLRTLRFPHSPGLLYSAFTYFCGFKVNSGEYKLMGLAPYGEPRFVEVILEKLVDLKPDGSLAMDMRYFHYCHGLTMTNEAFAALFGGPARPPEAEITQREMDLAASIQKVTGEIVLRMARHARTLTGCNKLCLAGGVALNCVANGCLTKYGCNPPRATLAARWGRRFSRSTSFWKRSATPRRATPCAGHGSGRASRGRSAAPAWMRRVRPTRFTRRRPRCSRPWPGRSRRGRW